MAAEEIQKRIAILKASVLKSDVYEKVEPIETSAQPEPENAEEEVCWQNETLSMWTR